MRRVRLRSGYEAAHQRGCRAGRRGSAGDGRRASSHPDEARPAGPTAEWVHEPGLPPQRIPTPSAPAPTWSSATRTYEIFNITAPTLTEQHDIDRLPYSIKVLLENLLRHEDGPHVSADDIVAVAAWGANPEGHGQGAGDAAHEIAFTPERVLMQDFTGVPAVVDLAAMRDALANLGGDATQVNPLVPGRAGHRPLGHHRALRATRRPTTPTCPSSTSATWSATSCCAGPRAPSTTSAPCRRAWASATRSTSSTCPAWSSPPRTGGPSATRWSARTRTPSWSTGSASSGWGVGGIEAEAAMLGQPLSMLLPPVVGLRISGEPKPGITATDVVLTVTELLRDHGVVGAFVECYGPGVAALPLETRATIGNMSPEYGATCTMFPIDQVTLDYLRFTGRDEDAPGPGRGLRQGAGSLARPQRARAGVLRATSRSTWATWCPRWPGRRGPRTGCR